MKLQAGFLYRTRDGRIAGPIMQGDDRVSYPWKGGVEGLETHGAWTADGRFFSSGTAHGLDLMGRVHRAADKSIDQMTLADYRRGVAKLLRSMRGSGL